MAKTSFTKYSKSISFENSSSIQLLESKLFPHDATTYQNQMEQYETVPQLTRQLSIMLIAISLVPVTVLLPVETGAIDKNIIPFYFRMRMFDLLDFTILAPFWIMALIKIRFIIKDHKVFTSVRQSNRILPTNSERFEEWFDLVAIMVFIYGHAIHVTGDSVNAYITEVNDYSSQVPADVYDLIYFLDEDLGHWLIFTALFGLIGFWTCTSNIHSRKDSDSIFLSYKPAMCAGAFMGLSFSFASIEGGSSFLGYLCVVYLFGCVMWKISSKPPRRSKRRDLNGNTIVKKYKKRDYLMVNFSVAFACSMFIGLTSYYFLIEGFHQPSQIGGFHGVIHKAHHKLFNYLV